MSDNPLLRPVDQQCGSATLRPIKPEHFRPAYDAEMKAHLDAVAAIAAGTEPATFANTIVPLETAGLGLARIDAVFGHLTGADTNPALQAVEREMAPLLAAHWDAIFLNAGAVPPHRGRVAGPRDRSAPKRRASSTATTPISCAPAPGSTGAGKARLEAINQRLAAIGTAFGQNVLADESSGCWSSTAPDDLAGLPDSVVAVAAEAAAERKLPGKYVITLGRSSIEPFLQFSTRRDLREKAFEAWIRRGEFGGDTDNRALIAETIALRAERAKLMGFASYAHFSLDDTMAKSPDAVADLLHSVWEPAKRAPSRRAGQAAGGDRSRRRQFPARRARLAALCRKGPQDRVRFRRGRAKALPLAGQDDRGGLRHRDPALRPQLRRVTGLDLYNKDARVWRVTRGRPRDRASSSATISPARASGAAPGCRASATSTSSTATCARSSST